MQTCPLPDRAPAAPAWHGLGIATSQSTGGSALPRRAGTLGRAGAASSTGLLCHRVTATISTGVSVSRSETE